MLNVISKESVDKYSQEYFGRKIVGDHHKQQKELDGINLEGYYKDQKYYFGHNEAGFRPETSIVVEEITESGENMITCKVESVEFYGDANGEVEHLGDKFSIDLKKKDNRYIIKNIKK